MIYAKKLGAKLYQDFEGLYSFWVYHSVKGHYYTLRMMNVATDRAALSPEAEDERDEGDQASHHPDVAETIKAVL